MCGIWDCRFWTDRVGRLRGTERPYFLEQIPLTISEDPCLHRHFLSFLCNSPLLPLPEPGRPAIWIGAGQGPTALAIGAGGGCLDIFTLIYPFSFLSPSLRETTRYGLKYCLKGSLSPKTTNQPLLPRLPKGRGIAGIFLSTKPAYICSALRGNFLV